MTFTRLLAMVGSPSFKGAISADSRRVGPGDVFVAIRGTHADGHDFIAQARENGASWIVCQEPAGCTGEDLVVVADSASALGLLAQQSFGNPSAQLTNLAVTGTNGKTTVSYLVRSVIEAAGAKCGLIGTIVYDTGTVAADATLTTPDALAVAQLARKMADDGAGFMVIEASSHALSQNRLAGVDFTAAAFTNLTGDHLDYHKTAEEYLAAKMRLLRNCPVMPPPSSMPNRPPPTGSHRTSQRAYYGTVSTRTKTSLRISIRWMPTAHSLRFLSTGGRNWFERL